MQKFYNKFLSEGFTKRFKFFVFLLSTTLLCATTSANNYVPNTLTDPVFTAVNNTTGAITAGAGIGLVSLRSALKAADNLGGTHTITLGTGTYLLDGSTSYTIPSLGTFSGRTIYFGNTAQNITINGNGPGNTIISMAATERDRIFSINYDGVVDDVFTTINGVKFLNGYLTKDEYGGAAIYAGPVGGFDQTLSVSNCAFENNICPAGFTPGNGGSGGAIYMFQEILVVDNCTFTNNSVVDGVGGAIVYLLYNNQGNNGDIDITNSTFTGNSAKSLGGAIHITSQGAQPGGITFTVDINKNTFLNNFTTTGAGGGIALNNGANLSVMQVHYNRFAGNISALPANSSGLHFIESDGSVNAENNWWGCNTNPVNAASTAPCNQAGGDVAGLGSLDANPWLQLKTTASPSTICNTPAGLGNVTTVTTSFLNNSDGTAIPVANLDRLIGLPVVWSTGSAPVLGSLSAQQTTIQANGTATATFTANMTGGNATVNTQVDNVPITDPTARATIVVNTIPVVTVDPANFTSCVGGTATFTATITGTPTPTFQWRIGTTPLVNGPQASGSTVSGQGTTTLTITNVQPGDELANYNIRATNHCGEDISANASLIVNSVTGGTVGSDQTICSGGDPAAFTESVASTGDGVLTYQWQSSTTSCAAGFSNIGGATATTYDPPSGLTVTTYYRRVTTSTLNTIPCTAISNCITVTINNVSGGTIATNQTFCSGGDPAAFTQTVASIGSGTLTYQWQSSTTGCGGAFSNIDGATAITYDPPAGLLVSTNYRRVSTSTLNGVPCTANSNCITVNINDVTGGTVGTDQTVCSAGDPAAFTESVASTGSGALTYQWQSGITGCDGVFANIGGANAATYDPPSGILVTTYYRRVTTSTLNAVPCTAMSNCITVTINNVTGGTVGSDQTICEGGDPAAFTESVPSTGDGVLSYQWQSSTTGCDGAFSNIEGATSATYDVPAGVLVTTNYRRVTTSTLNGIPCTANSNCITVTVRIVTGGTVAASQTICSGGDPAAFTESVPSTGDGVLTYQWQVSTTDCSTGFSDIEGATNTTYDPPGGLTVNTYYRRVTTSTFNGLACTANSNCLTISIATSAVTCPVNTSTAACQTQTAVNNAFTAWLATASGSGVGGVLTNNNTGAPSACGGSTTVTFTFTNTCDATISTCEATFTVTAPDEVILTCPVNTSTPNGQTQAAVNAAFAAWLATASGTGGCNGVLTNDNTGAPPASGGSTTVTFTYTSSCAPLTTTCQATFTVLPPVTLTCPINTSTPACQTQSAVNIAFAAWLATASAAGGSEGVLTNNNTGAPSACGGATTVTFTYTTSEPSTSTCSATFTVNAPPVVSLTCPVNTTTAACQTQADVNAAFSAWLATASGSGGCNGVLTNNNTGAPSNCGGSTTVTFTYTSSCDPTTTTCQATFTVPAPPTVTLTCPVNTTTAACLTQAQVNSAFSAWLATASGTGGCNGVLTNNNTGAPSNCGGSTTVTFTYTSGCDPTTTTCQATFTVPAPSTVTLTCPVNTSTAACLTQAQVNSAFSAWLATASGTGGCNGILTNNNTGAPPACGGSTTVTFTYTSSCAPLTTTCQATFTVPAPATVVLTCPVNTTTAACLTQGQVNAAFSAWLATASGTGGCSGILTNNNTGAPPACGGSTTVEFTYTSICAPYTTTCQATFTVPAPSTVVLTCPVNTTTSACLTQAQVNAAFSAWLATASGTGGCNGILTNNNTGAPDACTGGSTTVQFTYTSSCAPFTTTCQATFTVPAPSSVVLTCPVNTTTAACQSQSQINSAFAAWLATASAGGGCSGLLTNNNTGAPSACGGSTTVTFTYTSACAPFTTSCSATFTVPPDNTPPSITNEYADPATLWPPNHKMKDVYIGYTATDCGAFTTSLTVTSNEPINGTGDGDTSPDWEIIDNHKVRLRAERGAHGDGRIYTITITATDACGNTSSKDVEVHVAHNITDPISGKEFKVGSTVNFSGTFWDKPGNKHTGKWLIDGTSVNATITEPVGNQNGKSTGSYKFNSPGVYKLQMNITDQTGVTSYANTQGDLEAIVVIYDPKGGYTYGGGYYDSQAGALTSDPSATGKASYGFSMNYFKNSTNPKGETQFEFKVGDFEYNALNFDYLVINNSMSQFKGTGKIIGAQSGINFIMTVIDGQLDGTGVDKVRMKIYNKNTGHIYYDNMPGASDAALPVQEVGTNSTVVIQGNPKNNNLLTKTNSEIVSGTTLELAAYPNPTSTNYTIQVNGGDTKHKILLQVFDVSGRIVETRDNVTAGSTFTLGDKYRPGSYFIRIMQGKEHKEIKLVKLPD